MHRCDLQGEVCADRNDGVPAVPGAVCRPPGTESCEMDSFVTHCTDARTQAICHAGGIRHVDCTLGHRRETWVCDDGACVDARRQPCDPDAFVPRCSADGNVVDCGGDGFTRTSDCDADELCNDVDFAFPLCTHPGLGTCADGATCDGDRWYRCNSAGIWYRHDDCAEYPEGTCDSVDGCS